MNDSFQDLMHEATRLTKLGRLTDATAAIQRALNGAMGTRAVPRRGNSHAGGKTITPASAPRVVEGCHFELDERLPSIALPVLAEVRASDPPADAQQALLVANWTDADASDYLGRGEFISGAYSHFSQMRRYKLYIPPGHIGQQLPLVVMLHGCTQDADDFASGTGMNECALEQRFFVLYPTQPQDANSSRCWNWFRPDHQQRDGGEPALIAGITQAIISQHSIDARRVYIAGLSAGGAMAAIVAAAYPDIFAAVGVHSGIPCGAASSIAEAFKVMKTGNTPRALHDRANFIRTLPTVDVQSETPIPTIVFHGDLDRTVHPRNGEQVIADVLNSSVDSLSVADTGVRVEHGVSVHGRRYTRSTYHNRDGNDLAEHWVVHGAGHAWSGGNAEGSYTDAKGPDATREMLRFFLDHPRELK